MSDGSFAGICNVHEIKKSVKTQPTEEGDFTGVRNDEIPIDPDRE